MNMRYKKQLSFGGCPHMSGVGLSGLCPVGGEFGFKGSELKSPARTGKSWIGSELTKVPVDKTRFPSPHVDITVTHSIGDGEHEYVISSKDVRTFNELCWVPGMTLTAYQPRVVDKSVVGVFDLTEAEGDQLALLGSIAQDEKGIFDLHDGTMKDRIQSLKTDVVVSAVHKAVQQFLSETDPKTKAALAQSLHDVYIAIAWLEKFWMFDVMSKDGKVDYVIPEVIAKPYDVLSKLAGGLPEFDYYHHYVGAACSNMEEMQDKVDGIFALIEKAASEHKSPDKMSKEVSDAIVEWVDGFESLYSFRSSKSTGYRSELYFRFIHLAMEMVFSRYSEEIRAAYLSEDPDKIQAGLKRTLEVNRAMNYIFVTLVKGSKPTEYPEYVRKYIAGTFGRNCGTVFHQNGKFFVGCGDDVLKVGDATLKGRWVKAPGQTGANTTAVPVNDEFSGGATDFYRKKPAMDLIQAILRDDGPEIDRQLALLDASDEYTSLDILLTFFRTVTRPSHHVSLIVDAKDAFDEAYKVIEKSPELLLQLAWVVYFQAKHRRDHYYYVDRYINKQKKSGAQEKTTGTGGSDTTQFLPSLAMSTIKRGLAVLELAEELADEDMSTDFESVVADLRGKFSRLSKAVGSILDSTHQIKTVEQGGEGVSSSGSSSGVSKPHSEETVFQ